MMFAGSKTDDGPSTRLPDKSLLLFILDRLQKYDLFGKNGFLILPFCGLAF